MIQVHLSYCLFKIFVLIKYFDFSVHQKVVFCLKEWVRTIFACCFQFKGMYLWQGKIKRKNVTNLSVFAV